METSKLRCTHCLYWHPITHEGSAGTPLVQVKGSREGWGSCEASMHDQHQMRVKGFLETNGQHWCSAYVARSGLNT